MFKRTLKYSLIGMVVLVVMFLTVPMPGILFSKQLEFIPSEPISIVPNEENNGKRCLGRTIYYFETNGYTKTSEGIVNGYCANFHGELKNAIEAHDIDRVKDLLAMGASADSLNNDYDLLVPVVVAVSNKDTRIAKLLLDNGANPNQSSGCCMTHYSILQAAVKSNDIEMTTLLLERDADLNFKGLYGGGVLEEVAKTRNFEMFALIDNSCGADVFCRGELRLRSALNTLVRMVGN